MGDSGGQATDRGQPVRGHDFALQSLLALEFDEHLLEAGAELPDLVTAAIEPLRQFGRRRFADTFHGAGEADERRRHPPSEPPSDWHQHHKGDQGRKDDTLRRCERTAGANTSCE